MIQLNGMSPAIQGMVSCSAKNAARSLKLKHSKPNETVSINPRYAAALAIRLEDEHCLASLGNARSF